MCMYDTAYIQDKDFYSQLTTSFPQYTWMAIYNVKGMLQEHTHLNSAWFGIHNYSYQFTCIGGLAMYRKN